MSLKLSYLFVLRTRLNEFLLFKTARQGIHLCLGDLEKYKENICAHFNDDFDAEKIVQSKLPKTSLAVPEVSFDTTLHCKQTKRAVLRMNYFVDEMITKYR